MSVVAAAAPVAKYRNAHAGENRTQLFRNRNRNERKTATGMLLFRNSAFQVELSLVVRCLISTEVTGAFRNPWQNEIAERWVGNCRRDLLDHVIVLNERRLKHLLSGCVHYYHLIALTSA